MMDNHYRSRVRGRRSYWIFVEHLFAGNEADDLDAHTVKRDMLGDCELSDDKLIEFAENTARGQIRHLP
jgi:hypothetical protein